MKYWLMWALMALMAAGCARKTEQLYEGMPLKAWEKRLASDEPEVRVDALKVIAGIGRDALPLERAIREIARSDKLEDVRYNAIIALNTMGANVAEFQDFIAQYESPLLSEGDEEPEGEYSGEDTAPTELEEHASTEDDISFLKSMLEDTSDTAVLESDVMPADSQERELWIAQRQDATLQNLRDQLRNPRTLIKLLATGDLYERRFASRMLADTGGEDEEIVNALQSAALDADSLVRAAVKEAQQKWKLP